LVISVFAVILVFGKNLSGKIWRAVAILFYPNGKYFYALTHKPLVKVCFNFFYLSVITGSLKTLKQKQIPLLISA